MKQITEQDLLNLWTMYAMGVGNPTEQGFWDRLKVEYTSEEMKALSFPDFPLRGARDFDPRTMLKEPLEPSDPSEPVEPTNPTPPTEPTEPVAPPEPVEPPEDCDRMGWICPRCRGGVAPTSERCPCVSL